MCKRVVVLFFSLSLIFGFLFIRIGKINDSDIASAAASRNSVTTVISKSRGNIYDCNLLPLVNCDTVLKAAIKPCEESLTGLEALVEPDETGDVYKTLSGGKIAVCDSNAVFSEDYIKTASEVIRYGETSLAPHITGYIDGDGNGVSGIEKNYDSLLKSYSGTLKARCSVSASGKVLEGSGISIISDKYNNSGGVSLTVDRSIQAVAENALREYSIDCGAVVMLDAKTSEIRAMASAPTFDRNSPSESLNDENSPFINRAITPYSVGSVFKVVVAAAALESGISTDLKYTCNGRYTLNSSESFGCHKETGHGTLDMFGGMAQSCNPYFINLALKTGAEPISEMAQNLGLGQKIELADGWETSSGICPDNTDLKSDADLCNLAFGQGTLLASPLQMAAVYAAIANGGVYRAPSLMKSVIDENGDEIKRAELPASRRAMSVETAKTVTALLRETVVSGSGKKAETSLSDAAGKTATAQSGWFDENGNEATQSWFCGFFPYDSPQYVVVVLKENGEGGSADCAPVFKYIADNIR